MPMPLANAVAEYLVACDSRNLADGTLTLYKRVLNDLIKYLADERQHTDLTAVTLQDLESWLAHLRARTRYDGHPSRTPGGKLSGKTLFSYWRTAKTFFIWCQTDREWLSTNPADKLKGPKVGKVIHPALEPDEMNRLLAAIDTADTLGKRDCAFFLLLFDTGGRANEVLGAMPVNLSLAYRRLKIVGKGDKERYLFLSPETAAALTVYLAASPQNNAAGSIFRDRYGCKGWQYAAAWRRFRHYAAKAGVKVEGLHQCRRTAAVSMVEGGAPLTFVRDMLGHEDTEQTEDYLASIVVRAKQVAHDQYHSYMRNRERGPVKEVLELS